MIKNSKIFIFDILVHITFLYTILILFFYLIAQKIEKDSLEEVLNDNLGGLINGLENNLDVKTKLKIEEVRRKYVNTDKLMEEIRKITALDKFNNSNSKIKKNSIIILIIIYVITVLTSLLLVFKFKVRWMDLVKVLRDNLLLFAIICMIEMVFFMFIILDYVPVKPSFFVKKFIETINSYMENEEK